MSDLYIPRLVALIEQASKANSEAFGQAASRFADTLEKGGLVHLYGSGHSVLPAQEMFPRYGSFVGFNPLTDPRVMWHNVL
ncbi:MAG: SIS domain-containing protein, partial [Mesorhizobium sp.]